ncbi:peptide ABC transporter substrate-binding protein [Abyssisolibacter fermentans]|uniref:peptide ABC transporter substrate-binding protein n=1 Tax=Abyssisolibacter fermentans TaxID=1766203 RepID=UPI00082D45F3|nr:peptide ABC transporter substrate-binding protein [Abyssisolibacter fermentans]
MNCKKSLVLLLVVVFVISSFFVGCSNEQSQPTGQENQENSQGQDSNQENESQGSTEPKIDKDQVINLYTSEPKSLDTAKSTDVDSAMILTEITENLTRIEQDENGNDVIKPAAAKNWDINDDGTVWTFHLRDFNWEDGKPVTAHDFEYGIKRVLDPKTASQYAYLLAPIKGALEYNAGEATAEEVGIKALNDKTLEFTLKAPCAYFAQLTYFKTMLPQRKDIIEKYGDTYGTEADKIIGCGPFKMDKWVHNNEISIVKSDTYWDKDSVKLQRVNYKVINEPNARYNALYNGTIDSCGVSKTEWIEKFEKSGKFKRLQGYDPSTNYQFYNQKDELFKNANIRKAFSLSITREDMAEVIFHGLYKAAYGWVPPSLQIDGKDYRDLAQVEPLRKLKKENPDPKELLIKGLKELGLDPDPSKHTVTMLMTGTTQWDRNYAEYCQQMLKKNLGINMKAKYVEWPIFQKLTEEMDYQIGGMAWIGDYNDPMTFLDMWLSNARMVPTGWVNEEYDSIIAEAQSILDPKKRLECFMKAEHILLYEDAVIAPTVYRQRNTFRAKYVKNLMSPLFGTSEVKYAYIQGKN